MSAPTVFAGGEIDCLSLENSVDALLVALLVDFFFFSTSPNLAAPSTPSSTLARDSWGNFLQRTGYKCTEGSLPAALVTQALLSRLHYQRGVLVARVCRKESAPSG